MDESGDAGRGAGGDRRAGRVPAPDGAPCLARPLCDRHARGDACRLAHLAHRHAQTHTGWGGVGGSAESAAFPAWRQGAHLTNVYIIVALRYSAWSLRRPGAGWVLSFPSPSGMGANASHEEPVVMIAKP